MSISKFQILTCLVCISLLTGCSTSSKGKNGTLGSIDGAEGYLSEEQLNAQREARFMDGSIPTAEGEGIFRDVYFSLDSSQISQESLRNIEYNAQILNENPNIRIQLEGHCDERGTAEYNMALGSDRARSVFDMLSSLGISRERLDTISYGEEVPVDPSKNENAYAKNRRVHFSAYQ